jgi:hypothetical protein
LKAEDDDANKASVNKPKDDKQWLNPTDLDKWGKAVDYVAKGGNVSDIRKRYKLSKENEQKLIEQSKNK